MTVCLKKKKKTKDPGIDLLASPSLSLCTLSQALLLLSKLFDWHMLSLNEG